MVIDDTLEFASNFALPTNGIGTFYPSDNAKISNIPQSTGGEGLSLVLQISEDATSGGAAFVEFILASDSTGNIATDGSATRHFGTGPIPIASLVRGAEFGVALSSGPVYEQYLGILVKVSGAVLTGGRFNAFLAETPSRWTA